MADITLLVADDEPTVRQFVRQVVEREHAPVSAVYEAATGLEALELAVNHRPDLVFLDVRMPEMDGLQAAQAILRRVPETCVVIATAHEDFDYARAALRAGVADYLLKPIRLSEVMERIAAVHSARSTARPEPPDSPVSPEAPDLSYEKGGKGGKSEKEHPLVAAVAAYVEQHLGEPLDLPGIGRAVCVSPSHLSRMFKRHAGVSLTEFILARRLAAAEELLGRTELSMAEIAERAGFSNPAYFSACFRKKYGQAPSLWRRSASSSELRAAPE